MTLRVLVVDDEAPARRRLRRLLERITEVTVIGEAVDGADAAAKVAAETPDLLLLDINMPEIDGLQLAAAAPNIHVVFVTAHSEHAVAAFELAAVDYLLKPIREARLRAAIRRVQERRGQADPVAIAAAVRTLLPAALPIPRITATDGSTVRIFDAREIDRFSAANRYVCFVVDGREQLLDYSLNTLEERLAEHDFVRIHRAELVNLRFVVALRRFGGSAEVELTSGARVRVSRRLLPELERRLGARS